MEVENVGEGVEICWNEIEGAEGYYVYRKIEGGEYERLHEINDPTVTTFTDTTFVVGAKYGYTVRAYLGNEKSAYAYEKLQTDLGRVTVSLRTSDEGIQLEWNEITLAEGYYIYRRIGDDGDYELIDTIKEQSVTNYSDQQVESGKSYYYSVRAFLGDEESSYSGAIITAK